MKTVTIIGANGNMGSNVSGIISSFGNAQVFLISRRIEDSKKAIEKAVQSLNLNLIVLNAIANIIDVAPDSLIIELTGDQDKIDAFIGLLDGHNILELARTGIAGLSRGKENVIWIEE